ncbi:salicylate hydroxylase [Fusarium acutatum]|uniref:Salicylate hydroxylase n=1 Tax=Fusarium acutatum TaxID=78861 RepID=A0A8H4JCU2_9HYPO|nr:salicylate hydroxylase [Fusarium acutatum]
MVRVTDIQQVDGQGHDEGKIHVYVQFDADKSQESISCDILLGCDGIHSFVRTTVLDRERKKMYSGRAIAYGYINCDSSGQIGVSTSDGKPILRDSTMIQDKVTLKRDLVDRFKKGGIKGLEPVIRESDWYFYPVYMLPSEGRWSKGKVLLLGDAAHAMPPQGESTGIAIEDGVLFAHVLGKGIVKGVPYVVEAYEALRRDDIGKLHDETMFRWNAGTTALKKLRSWPQRHLTVKENPRSELHTGEPTWDGSPLHFYQQIASGELNTGDVSAQRLALNDLEDLQTIITQIQDINNGRFVFSSFYLKERHILYYWGRAFSFLSQNLLAGDEIHQPSLGNLKRITEYASDIESAVLDAGSVGALTSDYRLVLSERWDLLESALNLYHQHSQSSRTVSKWSEMARKIQAAPKVVPQETKAGLPTQSGTFTTILWLTFIGTTLSNVWTFALAYNYSDHTPGTTKDADFWFLTQSCITQGFTLIISGIPLKADPRLRKRTWVPPMLLALVCTIIAPPLYLTAPTEWSSFVGLIATGIQAFMVLQLVTVSGHLVVLVNLLLIQLALVFMARSRIGLPADICDHLSLRRKVLTGCQLVENIGHPFESIVGWGTLAFPTDSTLTVTGLLGSVVHIAILEKGFSGCIHDLAGWNGEDFDRVLVYGAINL